MRKSLRIASMVLAALLFFSYDSLKAQVKIGGNPAQIDPNAILELESNKKGFLLPRVSDMSLMSASATEGYLVYYTGSGPSNPAGLFVKLGGAMVRVTTEGGAGAPWKMDGNLGTPTSFMGTTNTQDLRLNANGVTGLTVGADGRLIFTPSFINYPLVTDPAINDVLVIAADGTVKKKDLAQTSVTKLNTLQGDMDITLEGNNGTAPAIATTAPAGGLPGIIELSYPIMEGQAAAFGFMTKADYDSLHALTNPDGFKVVAVSAAATAEGGVFTQNATTGKWELALSPASRTSPGIVSTTAQEFTGDKTFDGAVVIKKLSATPGAATLAVEGAVTLDGVTAQTLVNTDSYNLLLQNTTDNELRKVLVPGWKLTATGIGQISTPTGVPAVGSATGDLAFETVTTGTDFSISSVADKVTFALPDASVTNRGVVTIAAQSFTGDKTFETKVLVGPTAGAVATTSNLNVNGSLGVKFRTIATGSPIAADDYIVMVAATSATSAVTLPDATTCAGRVYVIKRIPGSNPVTEEDNNVVIATTSAQTINGVPGTSITVVHTSITVMSDGTNWQLLSRGTGF
ncbi:hypothetical protein GFS24_19205 [Chitinophaga sp. SYP-B3965]|uniref:hypothetical protein n=1 Tax=Chitinophaga sp. SYP-B3965 TaxID=2663120 RepID=UPI001299EB4D|nr:hypothetical protein [Chitinophaga sp. SYP-B3965]MRG47258.1 hypothetical protein [Chitinophaga sp. SYP-B3965]